MENSLAKAKEILASARGKELSLKAREQSALNLAVWMFSLCLKEKTKEEKKDERKIAKMLSDHAGKAFFMSLLDQAFRSKSAARAADQIAFLIESFQAPSFLSWKEKLKFEAFRLFGRKAPEMFVPFVKKAIFKEASKVILLEEEGIFPYLEKMKKEGVTVNLNRLGEAILGEEEALCRLNLYLDDLKNPNIEYLSVKVSTLYSQIQMAAFEESLEKVCDALRKLYREAAANVFIRKDGRESFKFVNLDMEEYKDLHLTVEAFKKVLSEDAFFSLSAGIVLQSYLPDSFALQKQLSDWAMKRVLNGGAPIKIRLVKGANLAAEQVEASLKDWPESTYSLKSQTDASYKQMLLYGLEKERAKAVHIGVASHNLFDIAFALLLKEEKGLQDEVSFEFLKGMAPQMSRVVQNLENQVVIYTPVAKEKDFHYAIAYLIRRLDENTGPENFLRHLFDLLPGSPDWEDQANRFLKACSEIDVVTHLPNRRQNRYEDRLQADVLGPFTNEPDTDFSLRENQKWAKEIIENAKEAFCKEIPLVINGKEIKKDSFEGVGTSPSSPERICYRYTLADGSDIASALACADVNKKRCSKNFIEERSQLLARVAMEFRKARKDLIAAMVLDCGKTVAEADAEVSEAIDFAEYYRRSAEEFSCFEDIEWSPKGVVLVVPPWNFPCSIASGGIALALAAGNGVIFKPAPESVLVGYLVAKIFWDAGVGKDLLQFVTCRDEPEGSLLVKDGRVDVVFLTGSGQTARHFLKLRPDIDLIAETGGKNAIVVTDLADKDLAVKDIVASAFGYSGQKCSACSLLILEASVYDDPSFLKILLDAAKSLKVGTPFDLAAKATPLIAPPKKELLRAMTTLEEGESWLLKPRADAVNPNLWSPGIKLGVKPGSFMHQTEFFGPLLGVMRAESLAEAIIFANGTPYGLTSGLHSLDEREQRIWRAQIEAGNCYINRGITGAIVRRQPFGGCKDSSFGFGSKAGGPNAVLRLLNAKQKSLALENNQINEYVKQLDDAVKELFLEEEARVWEASLGSYAYFWNYYFSNLHDPSLVMGQDNFLIYKPRNALTFRVQSNDRFIDIYRVIAAALSVGAHLKVSVDKEFLDRSSRPFAGCGIDGISFKEETEAELIRRICEIQRIRLVSAPSKELEHALAKAACRVQQGPVFANGRLELLNYVQETALSFDYHRYGNVSLRM